MQSFEELADAAIAFNRKRRADDSERLLEFAKTMPPAAFAREFCTVHLDVGRGVGKTTYIKNRQRVGDVIITPTFAECRRHFDGSIATCFSASEVNSHSYRGRTPPVRTPPVASIVYVDEPELVIRGCPLHLIYTVFGRCGIDQTFVLLGH